MQISLNFVSTVKVKAQKHTVLHKMSTVSNKSHMGPQFRAHISLLLVSAANKTYCSKQLVDIEIADDATLRKINMFILIWLSCHNRYLRRRREDGSSYGLVTLYELQQRGWHPIFSTFKWLWRCLKPIHWTNAFIDTLWISIIWVPKLLHPLCQARKYAKFYRFY